MIRWGEEKRRADPGFFCRTVVEGVEQPVWVSGAGEEHGGRRVATDTAWVQVVSDTRRLSDVEWFRDVYGDAVQTVRVVASEETRKRRNWVFVAGERALLPITPQPNPVHLSALQHGSPLSPLPCPECRSRRVGIKLRSSGRGVRLRSASPRGWILTCGAGSALPQGWTMLSLSAAWTREWPSTG